MNLNREISKKTLTDGFCLLYGENHRNMFDKYGEEYIQLGIFNGKNYFYNTILHIATRVLGYEIIRGDNNEDIVKTLKLFLSDEDIQFIFKGEYEYVSISNFAIPKKSEKVFQKISKELNNIKPTPIKKIESFDYFKQFPIYDTHKKNINLYTEGGFGLDQFNYQSVKYYLDENEEFYLAEAIPYKYHQLGSTLIREELRLDLIDKIKKLIDKDSNRCVKRALREMLKSYCFGSEEESTLLDIQRVCGEDGFETNKQINIRLKNLK